MASKEVDDEDFLIKPQAESNVTHKPKTENIGKEVSKNEVKEKKLKKQNKQDLQYTVSIDMAVDIALNKVLNKGGKELPKHSMSLDEGGKCSSIVNLEARHEMKR